MVIKKTKNDASETMNKKINFPMVSFLQFTFAIFVIMIHSSRLFQDDALHFIQKSLFNRMAVPFFVLCSAFLMRVKMDQDAAYQKKYVRRTIRTYLIWSVVFIPYGLYYFTTLSLSPALLPVGLIVAIFYIGMCYHLWYVPAFLTGLYLVEAVRKKVRWKWALVLFFILFTLGSIETYSAFLENTALLSYYSTYASMFFTSRNGLFFTPIFICLGFFLYDYKNSLIFTEKVFLKLLLSFVLLGIEGFILFPNPGLDHNFLFALIPFTLFLFNWAIRTDVFRNQSFSLLKKLSILYFFAHPIFIELLSLPLVKELFHPIYFRWTQFALTLIGTHLLSLVIIRFSQLNKAAIFKRKQ